MSSPRRSGRSSPPPDLQEQRRRRQERVARIAAASLSPMHSPTATTSSPLAGEAAAIGADALLVTSPNQQLQQLQQQQADDIERIRETRARRLRKERPGQEQQDLLSSPTSPAARTNSTTTPTRAQTAGIVSRADLEAAAAAAAAAAPTNATSVSSTTSQTSRHQLRASSSPATTMAASIPTGSMASTGSVGSSSSSIRARRIAAAASSTTTSGQSMAVRREDIRQAALLAYGDSQATPGAGGAATTSSTRRYTRGAAMNESHDLLSMAPAPPSTTMGRTSGHSSTSSVSSSRKSNPEQQQNESSSTPGSGSVMATNTSAGSLSSRLLERREARASERRQLQQQLQQQQQMRMGSTAPVTRQALLTMGSDHDDSNNNSDNTLSRSNRTVNSFRLAEVERRLARRKSGDVELMPPTTMNTSTSGRESLEGSSVGSSKTTTTSRYRNEVERRLARRRSSDDLNPIVGATREPTPPNTRISREDLQRESAGSLMTTTAAAGTTTTRGTSTGVKRATGTSASPGFQDLILESNSSNTASSTSGSDYSLKVRVLSATDLPSHAVPFAKNIPLCPVVKLGLVKLPHDIKSVEMATALLRDHLWESTNLAMTTVEESGSSIEDVPHSRTRSTTCKLMGKRDNGSIEFDQELRWDQVPFPLPLDDDKKDGVDEEKSNTDDRDKFHVGIVVEVAARAVRTPANIKESPLPIYIQTGQGLSGLPASPLSPAGVLKRGVSTGMTATEEEEMSAGMNPARPTEELTPPPNMPLPSMPQPSLSRSASSSSDDDLGAGGGALRALWDKATNRKTAELEKAEAAAAIARMLVEQGIPVHNYSTTNFGSLSPVHTQATKVLELRQIQYNVALRKKSSTSPIDHPMCDDWQLGCVVIPLSQLPIDGIARNQSASAVIQKMFPLWTKDDDEFRQSRGGRRVPNIKLELTFSHSDTMDQDEDRMGIPGEGGGNTSLDALMSMHDDAEGRAGDVDKASRTEKQDALNPLLQGGVVDFIAIVGCTHFNTQPPENGAKGWIEESPEYTVLEQFPPNNEFHIKHGRKALLPEMVQWFCFPEGARAWRGDGPPSHLDMKLKRFSASTPANVASSIAAFDACLNCTTSFSWFVIASNSDEYGSKLVKTYGAVLRFYVPAPMEVSATQQDDTLVGEGERLTKDKKKRIWIPMAICFTSNLPIIGIMEAMMLRLCEDLSSKDGPGLSGTDLLKPHEALWDLIVTFQKPMPGVINCSVPFLSGERFLLSLPQSSGLPPLPHGKAIVSTCRLLGPDGLNFLLAAALTECKILLHSNSLADIAMVAEVVTALLFPFFWSLPYIPILPLGMLEFVEAPLSYMLGIPTQSLRLIDPSALDDVVVIDLNSTMSSLTSFARRNTPKASASKNPPPLPSQVSNNISRAVHHLIRDEEDIDMEYGMMDMAYHSLPGLETESLAEREFRVSVAIEICSLLRGYQECTGAVFNRDKFLKIAPGVFEEKQSRRGPGQPGQGQSQQPTPAKVVSARSKRFLSLVVNTQNFHQFIESLEEKESGSFFHEIMETFDDASSEPYVAPSEKTIAALVNSLQEEEDRVPTYRLSGQSGDERDDAFSFDENVMDILSDDFMFNSATHEISSSFTNQWLLPMKQAADENATEASEQSTSPPWRYNTLLDIQSRDFVMAEPINLRQALGDRRYRAWRQEQDEKGADGLELGFSPRNLDTAKRGNALDLTTLVSSMTSDDALENMLAATGTGPMRQTATDSRQQKITDAKDRDIIRRCLDRANEKNGSETPFIENGRDLLSESEKALRNPSAQRFLLSVLAQRTRLEGQRTRGNRRANASQMPMSRLDHVAFECLVRMSCAILDSCMDYREYETAYRLLTLTAGFTSVEDESLAGDEGGVQFVLMTSRIAIHPVFADLAVWKTVMNLQLIDRRNEKKAEPRQTDNASVSSDDTINDDEDEREYEAAVATLYEMQGYNVPGEELSRFATRVSEEKGWFSSDDRGRQLLVLARRITVRRDQTDIGRTGDSALEIIGRSQDQYEGNGEDGITATRKRVVDEKAWTEIAWCHPAAQELTIRSNVGSGSEYMKRSPVTALASFGQSVAVSAGLDGGVFLAYSIHGNRKGVRGIHLDWGSASRGGASASLDGEYGVGM